MKKLLFIGVLTTTIFSLIPINANAQVEEGHIMIDPYIGAPPRNAFAEVIWFDFVERDNFKRVGTPVTFGGRIEYMLIDQLSLGLDLNYSASGFQYNAGYTNNQGVYTDNALYKYSEKTFRGMLRVNFYFVRTERFNMYTGLGAGYKSLNRSSTVDGEDLEFDIYEPTIFFTSPIAARIAIGGKFYFTENIGFNFEFGGFGGSIVQLGLATKF